MITSNNFDFTSEGLMNKIPAVAMLKLCALIEKLGDIRCLGLQAIAVDPEGAAMMGADKRTVMISTGYANDPEGTQWYCWCYEQKDGNTHNEDSELRSMGIDFSQFLAMNSELCVYTDH